MGTHKRWWYKESCCIFLRGDMASSSNVFRNQSKNLPLYLVCMQIQTSMSDGMIAYTFLHFMIGWGWEGVWKGQKRRKHWTFTKEDFNFPVWDWAKFRWPVTNLNLVFLHWTYLSHLWCHFPILGLFYGCGCCPEMHLVFNSRHLAPTCFLFLHVDDCIFHKEPILRS